ncbi:hypothetical protein B0G83_104139 [Paraburkholderia sp. BL21I4N1]|nr:hypothetical protein B0G83_104139 [Paraburkholderia sp. BL21I4N1]
MAAPAFPIQSFDWLDRDGSAGRRQDIRIADGSQFWRRPRELTAYYPLKRDMTQQEFNV